jgi:hypothetical protein
VWNDDGALEEVEMCIALRDLQQDPRRPAGLELVVYGSIGHSQLYSFPMKPRLDVPFQESAQKIETVSIDSAVNSVQSVASRMTPAPRD